MERDQPVPRRVLAGTARSRRTPAASRPRAGRKIPISRPRARRRRSARFIAAPLPVGHSTVERVAEVAVVDAQRLDQQVVDREPHRAAPVGVAAEQAARRLAGLVVERRASRRRCRPRAGWPGGGARARASRGRRGTPSGSSIAASSRRSRCSSTIDSIRQPACSVDSMCWTTCATLAGGSFVNHSHAGREVGQPRHRLRPERRDRGKRQQADDRARSQRHHGRRRVVQDVVVEAVLSRPTGPCVVASPRR